MMRAFYALAFATSILAACGPSQPPPPPEPPPAIETPALPSAVPSAAPSSTAEAAKPSVAPVKTAAAAPANAATGDVANGQRVFNQCRACHTIEAGAGNRVGPSLHGVIGRKSGALPDFAYSPAMKDAGVTWNAASLDEYLANPAAKLPGNRMTYLGVKKPNDRRDVIAYIEAESKK